jgi:hypothetical protein
MKDQSNKQVMDQHLYSFQDAARKLGNVSVYTIHKHAAQSSVKVTRIGRRVFLSADELERISKEGLPSLSASEK